MRGAHWPDEHPDFAAVRAHYYRHRQYIAELEMRITATQAGMEWLGRVKRIGYWPRLATKHRTHKQAA